MNDAAPLITLPKTPTGIAGFDEVTQGGLPAGRPTLICGGTGCGKTMFATSFLINGIVQYNETGVFMSFEEREEDLALNVASLGYDLNGFVADRKLVVDHVRFERSEMEENGDYDLEGLFLRLGCAVEMVGAKRVVLDTIETLFAGFTSPTLLRGEIRTGESGDGTQFTRQGLEEYVSDCVVLLDNRVQEQVATRWLRIVKYRGSAHGTNEYPFLIDGRGISVMPEITPGRVHSASDETVSTGVAGLDEMFQTGGFYRGSSILVSGVAGTGKTTLGAHFIHAACARGERCILFGFEETAEEYIRNALSVGVDLKPWLTQNVLHVEASRPTVYGLEMHLARLHRDLAAFQPDTVVIDPVSAFRGPSAELHVAVLRMVDLFKSRGITALFTSLQTSATAMNSADQSLSSVMDNWIRLSDVEANGERNHVLYVIKARGQSHSNQVREYRISKSGVELIPAYVGPDGVLTGAARMSQEAREKAGATRHRLRIARHRRDLALRHDALQSQISGLNASLEATEEEANRLLSEDEFSEAALAGGYAAMAAHRGAKL
jgi:circadian clock protein KaiC